MCIYQAKMEGRRGSRMKGNRGKEPEAWGQGGDSEPLHARHWGETNKTQHHYLRNLAYGLQFGIRT